MCVGLFLATYVLAVHSQKGRLLDGASMRGAVDTRSSVDRVIERVLDVVTVSSLLLAAALVAIIALLRA